MTDGRTVMELAPNSASVAEIEQLWDYVWTRLKKSEPTVVPYSPARRVFGRRAAVA